jgi:hypothetical protein
MEESIIKAPKGFEKNWIKTIPGEGWFTLPQLYEPLEPILDKMWRWNDKVPFIRPILLSLHQKEIK